MAPTVDQTLPETLSRTTLFSLGAEAVRERRTFIQDQVYGDDLDDDDDDDDLDDDDELDDLDDDFDDDDDEDDDDLDDDDDAD